jgi:hypothetical protein
LIKKINASAVNFFSIFALKTLDPELDLDPEPQLGKMLDPDPH